MRYPPETVRLPSITVLLLLAVLPLVRCHPHTALGPVGLVHHDLNHLAAERRAGMTVPHVADTHNLWYPWVDHDRLDAIIDAVRVERLNRVVTVADERPASSFFAATQILDGWLFASADGVLYRAQTFTGPLVVFEHIPRELRFHPESYGRMVLGDSRGRWWTTDGSTPMEAMAVDARPLAMAFASARRGAAVLQGGRLIATDDAGHTWRAVHTDLIAYNVSGSPDALLVGTLDGVRTLLPDLTLTPEVHIPLAPPDDFRFLLEALSVPSLELPSGSVDLYQESGLEERYFHVQDFQCHDGPAVLRPLPDMHGEFLARAVEEGLGPAADRVVGSADRESVSITWRGRDILGDYAHTLHDVPLHAAIGNRIFDRNPLILLASTRAGVVIAHDQGQENGFTPPLASHGSTSQAN